MEMQLSSMKLFQPLLEHIPLASLTKSTVMVTPLGPFREAKLLDLTQSICVMNAGGIVYKRNEYV